MLPPPSDGSLAILIPVLLLLFLLLRLLRVILGGVPVQLEQLHSVKIRKVRHKLPEGTPSLPPLLLRYRGQDEVDVAADLHEALLVGVSRAFRDFLKALTSRNLLLQ